MPCSQATFLDPGQAQWLHRRQAAAAEAAQKAGKTSARQAVRDARLWHLAAISLVANIPKYGVCVLPAGGLAP